jgi:hypothetical protein
MEPVRAEVTPRTGAWIAPERLQRAIKSAGFRPGDILYTVTGVLTNWQGQPALRLSGSERVVLLQREPKAPEAYERAWGTRPEAGDMTVEVEGQLVDRPVSAGRSVSATLRIRRLEIHG